MNGNKSNTATISIVSLLLLLQAYDLYVKNIAPKPVNADTYVTRYEFNIIREELRDIKLILLKRHE